MTTAADIVARALRRLRVTARGEDPAAEDASAALVILNDMMAGWKLQGVDVLHEADLASGDTFVFFVPPAAVDAETIAALDYQSTWDANANSPSLASATGTEGYVYKVATAGSTTLDDVTSWAINDYAIFDGQEWLKGQSSRPFEGGVVAMLALRLIEDEGKEPSQLLVSEAYTAWNQLASRFVKPSEVGVVDTGLVNVSSRRFLPDGTILS